MDSSGSPSGQAMVSSLFSHTYFYTLRSISKKNIISNFVLLSTCRPVLIVTRELRQLQARVLVSASPLTTTWKVKVKTLNRARKNQSDRTTTMVYVRLALVSKWAVYVLPITYELYYWSHLLTQYFNTLLCFELFKRCEYFRTAMSS